MQTIEGLLLEPVGCLAEFPPGPFHEIAVRFFGRKGKSSPSGSRSYWHLLNLMEQAGTLDGERKKLVEALEMEAVTGASIYEDVLPVLAELKTMGIRLCMASSLSRAAVTRSVEPWSLDEFLAGVWTRDETAGGVKSVPLLRALEGAGLAADKTMFLTDTVEGIKAARGAGVHPVLMMNDPDEARRLATHNPAGGIVSLHEMPDFIRLIAAQNRRG
jgi:beta-phosphoglucomutase-like phosphatase (HAD superfamily)